MLTHRRIAHWIVKNRISLANGQTRLEFLSLVITDMYKAAEWLRERLPEWYRAATLSRSVDGLNDEYAKRLSVYIVSYCRTYFAEELKALAMEKREFAFLYIYL